MKRVIAILLSFVLIGAIGCDVGNDSSEQNDFANVYVEQTDAGFSVFLSKKNVLIHSQKNTTRL